MEKHDIFIVANHTINRAVDYYASFLLEYHDKVQNMSNNENVNDCEFMLALDIEANLYKEFGFNRHDAEFTARVVAEVLTYIAMNRQTN